MQLLRHVRNLVVPHASNAYRPHLLARSSLMFFLAAILATEGFLVASLVARQSEGSFLASAYQAQTEVAAPFSASNALNSVVRQLPRAVNARGASWVLGGITTALVLVLILTFVMHLQVQPTDLLVRGVVVVGLAVALMAFNATYLSQNSQVAGVAASQSTSQ